MQLDKWSLWEPGSLATAASIYGFIATNLQEEPIRCR